MSPTYLRIATSYSLASAAMPQPSGDRPRRDAERQQVPAPDDPPRNQGLEMRLESGPAQVEAIAPRRG